MSNKKSRWQEMPNWKKRLHGFFSYQAYSIFALLIDPVAADKIMFDCLKYQFAEENNKESKVSIGEGQ